jgi:hypothetical protein
MFMVNVHVTFPIIFIHVHAWECMACCLSMHANAVRSCRIPSCPGYMSVLHAHAACAWCMRMLHFQSYPYCMSMHVHHACRLCMSMPHDLAAFNTALPCRAAYLSYMCMLCVNASYRSSYPCCMSMQQVHAACPCCMPLLYIFAGWPCFMSIRVPWFLTMLHIVLNWQKISKTTLEKAFLFICGISVVCQLLYI